MISVFEMMENIVGKGENAGQEEFLLFSHCFEKSSAEFVKTWECVVIGIVWLRANISVTHTDPGQPA